ncbi:hypothetical protein GLAREA_07811 [Glarea lozoyensis ATCC 20868]|uniref:Lysine-specific metallo-endopeptidase domain-containing protein n=1 Tax=Glarea lozoyensis (strain ATCC 20868 / MF5171) TaxID=1116229 RepID=S3D2B5_GLAL2|nr:uncharacterized protein GLAREA_07811 [Glarea lozoyensis ATCC 20868]EPE32677.1 hypothetical protein GLAREA_07811 [Glarea lozoyensis ATCC 20868]
MNPHCLFVFGFLTPDPRRRSYITTQSVKLQFNDECDKNSSIKIRDAWEDATKLAKNVETINWDDVAAHDFFGPSILIKNQQTRIQKVFDSVATFGQAMNAPGFSNVTVNIACSPKYKELDNKCKNNTGIRAHTWNTANSDGTGGKVTKHNSTINMVICNYFFGFETLAGSLDASANLEYPEKYNLDSYRNRGYIILHELMHGDRATFEANAGFHISDLEFHVHYYEHTEKKLFERTFNLTNAYGALNTRILAHASTEYIGSYTADNADSFAQYALAKYVQKKINAYPWLPFAEAKVVGDINRKMGSMIVTEDTGMRLIGDNIKPSCTEGCPDKEDLNFRTEYAGIPEIPPAKKDEADGEEKSLVG